jgi:hypothetical protein
MDSKRIFLCVLCVLCGEPSGSVCWHAGTGESRRVTLGEARRAQDDIRTHLAWAAEKVARTSIDAPYDSGLPACPRRERRVLRGSFARELAGRTLGFGPSGRIPAADLRVASSVRRLIDVEADALADRGLAERLGVRCVPTVVRIVSEVELELVENP